MNKVILMGRLTRDPDIRHSQGENASLVSRFTLAVDRRFRRDASGQEADFISCVAFGKTAEFSEKYLHKGTKVVLSGRIQTGSYTNREGQKVYTTDVIAEDLEFAESKRSSDSYSGSDYSGGGYSGGGSSYDSQPSYSGGAGGAEPSSDFDDGFMNVPEGIDDELPFN
ncbi:MAG: single-stranded DNA-binding protein [Lachnospiraceae bacterium]|nr:single-stranded DNA-binding protein [Lachnospiraceae bacterium]